MPTDARRLLLDVLDCAFDKRSWHGANLTGALRGVGATLAAKSLPKRKSIWQQALHAAYWKQVVLNKLTGATPFPRAGSNWPRMPAKPTDAAWKNDLALLHDIHKRLRKAVANLPPAKLSKKTIWLIHGVAAHDLYHTGQIKLLIRLLKGRP